MPWGIFDCTMVIERRELRKKYQRNKITFLQLKDTNLHTERVQEYSARSKINTNNHNLSY